MKSAYTGRKDYVHAGTKHFAKVTIQAYPCTEPSIVSLSLFVIRFLRDRFDCDYEYQRHNVHAAVAAQIGTINVSGHAPHAGATSFRVEVTDVAISDNEDRRLSGFLLSVAGMNAIENYLCDWELEQRMPLS